MQDYNPPSSTDDTLGLERLGYARFYNSFVTRRPNQAPTKMDNWNELVLPVQSVLHTLNGFDTLHPKNDGMPDPAIPLVTNEKSPVFLKIHTKMADETDFPFGVKESYIYRPATLLAAAAHYHTTYTQFRRILSDRVIGSIQGVLTWVDYSPLNEARVNGTMGIYRKFDILFRTILNNVVKIGSGKYHYIHLPQSGGVFGKPQLNRTFKELTNGSLNSLSHDPSIFPIIHLLGYVFGKTNNLNVTPYKEDILVLGKDGAVLKDQRSTSLLERIPSDLLDSINFIIQKDDKAIVYNLGDLTRFAQDSSFYTKFYRHIMSLRVDGAVIPDHVDTDSEQFDNLVSSLAGDKQQDELGNVTIQATDGSTTTIQGKVLGIEPATVEQVVGITPVTKSETIEASDSHALTGKGFEEKIRTVVNQKTQTEVQKDTKVVTKRQQLVEAHFNVLLGGKTLGELIQTPLDAAITPKNMDFLKDVPDESYRSTSVLAIDKNYREHGYHHELAKVIGSLAKHGYYATKIEESRVNTEMDKTVTYKVILADEGGRSHHVKFTIPELDDAGLMKLSGTEYRLTRQIANVPICKVSPTRVNLSSYYNKIIVDRVQTKRNSFEEDIHKLISTLKANDLLEAVSGGAPLPTKDVPYDYTAIGRNYTEIKFDGFALYFDADGADKGHLNFDDQDRQFNLEGRFGIFAGTGPDNTLLYWDKANQIHQVNKKDEVVYSWTSFNHLLFDRLGDLAFPTKTVSEWTEAKIINQEIPLVFILGYRFGLKAIFDKINLDYQFYPTGSKPVVNIMDIVVKFADGSLVFNRYPISRSLIASGLNWVALKDINFRDMNLPNTYTEILAKKKMTVGVLKGINGFYDFFVDPITETILEKMGEPITFHELLLRASILLSDYVAIESSSVENHRFRLHERFNGMVYNEIYRSLANYRNNPSARKAFSINPEAVFQKIVQDPTISPNDVTNPVHEVKQLGNFTFTGAGGRTGNSFVLRDRIYPKDGLGVISESVPDSGKVGITAYLSASPRINDIHGLPVPYKDGDTLTPPQILSIGAMVMPSGTADDGKRANYLSIQISHYVPNHHDGETLAVRTGYDEVLPHLAGELFSSAAEEDGVVESVDDKNKVIKVRYREKLITTLGSVKLPYLESILNQYRDDKKIIGFLIPEDKINDYPMGGVFSLTKTTNGRVIDRLRIDSVDAIPDKDVARKQPNLVQDFARGRYNALYYIRFSLIGIKTQGEVKSFSYANAYSPISGAYLLQTRKPNVQEGERFKRGDILVYNPGFFVPNPLSKQVTFKHGVTATVALMEKGSNHEDACEVSRDIASRLKMTPSHQREIVTTKDAVLLKIVKLGDHVETSDSLCIISDDYVVQTSLSLDVENLDIMEKLNRQTPSAGYTGVISKIRILYGCDRDKLSDTLKTVLKAYEKESRDSFKAMMVSDDIKPPERPGWVAPGTKYKGIDFSEDTVVIEFMIQEELGIAEGDKICLANSSKSIVSIVSEKQHYTQSGLPVDVLFSGVGIANRIVSSPFNGLAERNLAQLKKNIIDMYFGE